MKTRFFTMLVLVLGFVAQSFAQDTIEPHPIDFQQYARCHSFSAGAPDVVYQGCWFNVSIEPHGEANANGYYYRLAGPGNPFPSLNPMPSNWTIPVYASTLGSGFVLWIYKDENEQTLLCQKIIIDTEVKPKIVIDEIEVVNTQVTTLEPKEVCCGNTQNFTYNESYCFGTSLSAELQATIIPDVLGVAIGASVSQEWCIAHGVENACTAPEDACVNLYRHFERKDVVINYHRVDCDGNQTGDDLVVLLNDVLTNVTATCSPMPHEPDCSEFTLNETHVHPSNFFFDGEITVSPSGGSGQYEYFWSHDSSLPVTTNSVSNLPPGFYNITVTDVTKCCTKIISVELINCELDVEFITYIDHINNGLGITAQGVGSGWDFNYEWDSGETDPWITAIFEGNYCVTVTDDNGCVADDCYDAYCPGMSIYLNWDESWYPGEFDITADVTNYADRDIECYWEGPNGPIYTGDCYGLEGVPYGTYTLSVWDGLCWEYETIFIPQPCYLSIYVEQDWFGDVCVEIDGPSPDWTDYDIVWEVHDCVEPDILDTYYGTQCAPGDQAGEYCVLVTYNVDGCWMTQTACILIDCFDGGPTDAIVNYDVDKEVEARLLRKMKAYKKEQAKVLAPTQSTSDFKAYPNPFTYEINVDFSAEKEEELTIQLLDVFGRTIQSENTNSIIGENKFQLPVSNQLPEGIYFVRVIGENGENYWTNRMLHKGFQP